MWRERTSSVHPGEPPIPWRLRHWWPRASCRRQAPESGCTCRFQGQGTRAQPSAKPAFENCAGSTPPIASGATGPQNDRAGDSSPSTRCVDFRRWRLLPCVLNIHERPRKVSGLGYRVECRLLADRRRPTFGTARPKPAGQDMGLNVSKVASISSTGAPGIGHQESFATGRFQASRSTPVGTRVLAALINAQVHGSRTALSRHQLLGFGARALACLRWSATSGAAQAVKPIPAGRLAASAVWWE